MSNAAEVKRLLVEAQLNDQNLKEIEARKAQSKVVEDAAEKTRRWQRIEAIWRPTGVLGLFEELRDQGVVTSSNNPVFEVVNVRGIFGSRSEKRMISRFEPAKISASEITCYLSFDYTCCEGRSEGSLTWSNRSVTATLKNGLVYINNKLPKDGLNCAVAEAIVEARKF